jgi:hypothetical protein
MPRERDESDVVVPGARMVPEERAHNPRGDEDVTPDPAPARFPIRRVRARRTRRSERA